MTATTKFLPRVHFSPGAPPGYGNAKPCIVQYHPQATQEVAKRQGVVIADVAAFAAEHGPSLAAGPAALDLLSRLLVWYAKPFTNEAASSAEHLALMDEARALVAAAKPPEGSIHPNGTVRSKLEREGVKK